MGIVDCARLSSNAESIMMMIRSALAVILGVVLAFGGASEPRADEFPSRSIKIVVGFGPGGIGDIAARSVAQRVSDATGRPVVIENMPGAGGLTAAASVARASPDGYTMLLVSAQNVVNPYLFKSMPYEPGAFAMVSTIGSFHTLVLVRKDSPYRTIADLLEDARRNPQRVNIGTISAGSIQHLSALLFASAAKLDVPTVPFRTTSDVITALMGGEVQVAFEMTPAVFGQLQSGALRVLAVWSEQRLPMMPDVPTLGESGVPGDYQAFSWNGLVVPAKTPRPVVAKLNAEVVKAVADPGTQARLSGLGVFPQASTPEEMQGLWDTNARIWREVIAGAKLAQ